MTNRVTYTPVYTIIIVEQCSITNFFSIFILKGIPFEKSLFCLYLFYFYIMDIWNGLNMT